MSHAGAGLRRGRRGECYASVRPTPLCPLEVMMICPSGSTGLDHAAPEGLFRWAMCCMHLCRAVWFDNGMDYQRLGPDLLAPWPPTATSPLFMDDYVLKQTSDEATPTLVPFGGQFIRRGVGGYE